MGWRYEKSQADCRLIKQISFFFSTLSPTQLLIKFVQGARFSGLKRVECEIDHFFSLVRCLRISIPLVQYTLTAWVGTDRLLSFLGAFAILRKATVSFVMSLRLIARNASALIEQIFMKFNFWEIFDNLSRKFKFH